MHSSIRHAVSALSLLIILLGGCASAPEPTTVIRTLYNPNVDGFDSVLVISVTGDYATRAAVERDLVASISSGSVSASAWYTVVGRRPQVTQRARQCRPDGALMQDTIRSRGYGAVLFVRQKGQEQEELAPLRPVGAAFDLFGYDYEELNRDEQIEQSRAITFVAELYDASAQRKVWAIEALSVRKNTLQELIDEQVVTIATQLREDGLLDR